MPKIRKTLQPKNLAKYDVYIEDRTPTSDYFNVTNLPQVFTGGRNSFLIGGSQYLKNSSNILVEILDANGKPIYQNPVPNYLQGNSRLLSIEINEDTAVGYATIILLGVITKTKNNQNIPADWENKYNTRWVAKVLVEPRSVNVSPLVFVREPLILAEEKRLYDVSTSSFSTTNYNLTASLTPILYSSFVKGYLISPESPATFSSEHFGGVLTGSLIIDGESLNLRLPITNILNSTTAYSEGYVIQRRDGKVIDKITLYSGSYQTTVLNQTANITTSANLTYNRLNTVNTNVPVSYAKLRIADMNTVSGEVYKTKVYSKVSTNIQDFKLVADIKITTNELLTTSSLRGDFAAGDFYISPSASASWYSDILSFGTNPIYTISGSSGYYDSTNLVTPFSIYTDDSVLISSIYANVPTFNNEKFANQVSESGYFIGSKRPIGLFPTTEYTLEFTAYYKNFSGSVNLVGLTPSVDIYIVGVDGYSIISNDPLGQKIGKLTVVDGTVVQLYENVQFNFKPELPAYGNVGIRFVITNGFWNFSKISLKPASDALFSPDEIELLVPNTEYFNDYLEHKVEFFDINNNSTGVQVTSIPTFFTGSYIDLGILR
jgi:hypothetical protein